MVSVDVKHHDYLGKSHCPLRRTEKVQLIIVVVVVTQKSCAHFRILVLFFLPFVKQKEQNKTEKEEKKSTTPDMSYSCLAAACEVCRIFRLKQR